MTGRKPRAPAGLGEAGRVLWRRLAAEYQFDPRELVVVEQAARQADALVLLESVLAEQGPTVVGSMGQPKLSPVVAELRQGRLALARLLDVLDLPDVLDTQDTKDPPVDIRRRTTNGTARRARHAANVRWARLDREEVRRGAGSS